jgi:hypothetical protein
MNLALITLDVGKGKLGPVGAQHFEGLRRSRSKHIHGLLIAAEKRAHLRANSVQRCSATSNPELPFRA